jgi:phthiocerol/phenolphthiocerol synthesis type-I polyketide synthase E
LSCRAVDFETGSGAHWSQRAAQHLQSELQCRSTAALVAYRGTQRWIEEFAERMLGACAERPRLIREQGVYVITGGLGRIGLTLAEYLGRVAGARLVLVGRSPLPPADRWDDWIRSNGQDDPTSRILAQLRVIEAGGAEILALSADVADAASLRDVVALVDARYGRIDGVIHAAGITSGSTFAPMTDLDRIDFDQQFHPKIAGALSLSSALRDRPLDFCMLLSSVSTVLGGVGFAAYAGANAFLDAFAVAQTRQTGVPWISIGLDGWAFDSPETKRSGAAALAMTPKEGVDIFSRVLNGAPWPRVVISTAPLNARRNGFSREPAKAEPETAPSERQARPQTAEYVAPRTDTEQRVAAIWEDLIGIAPIGVNDDFFDLGGHSLLGTRVMSRVREAFDVELTLAALFADPNVAGLSARVDQQRAGADGADRTAKMLARLKTLGAEDRRRLLEKARHSREAIG